MWFIVDLAIEIGVFLGDVVSGLLGCGEAGSSGLIRFDKCDTRYSGWSIEKYLIQQNRSTLHDDIDLMFILIHCSFHLLTPSIMVLILGKTLTGQKKTGFCKTDIFRIGPNSTFQLNSEMDKVRITLTKECSINMT